MVGLGLNFSVKKLLKVICFILNQPSSKVAPTRHHKIFNKQLSRQRTVVQMELFSPVWFLKVMGGIVNKKQENPGKILNNLSGPKSLND